MIEKLTDALFRRTADGAGAAPECDPGIDAATFLDRGQQVGYAGESRRSDPGASRAVKIRS